MTLSINLFSDKVDQAPRGSVSTPDTQLKLDSSADGLSGTLTCERLGPAEMGDPNAKPVSEEAISGTVTWTCQG